MTLLSTSFILTAVLAQVQTDFPTLDFGNNPNNGGSRQAQGGRQGENQGFSQGGIDDGYDRTIPSDNDDITKFVVVGVIILAAILTIMLFVYRARYMNRNRDSEYADEEKNHKFQNSTKVPEKIYSRSTKHDSLLDSDEFELSKFGIETTIAEQSFNTLDSDPRSRNSVIYDRTISNPRDSVGLIKNVKRVTISGQDGEGDSDETLSRTIPSAMKTPLPSALKKPQRPSSLSQEHEYFEDDFVDQSRYKNPQPSKRPSLTGLFRK